MSKCEAVHALAEAFAEALTEEGVTFADLMQLRAEAIEEARREMEKIKGADDEQIYKAIT